MKTVKIYSTPTCPYCIRLKDFLKSNNVEFENIDVSADQAKAKEMVERSGQMGVPVADIDGEIIVGFDRARISQALGI
ncbi:MAG: glutaredoxin domain-containing protein [Candidatus Omnitrophica bacterium]|nr:glutaredoxin domain-containing protein [Candidatus Omnitrophota bacterium]MDD5487691.1 glutaredoxin domain-containing protein [Candidatus Omnitrophota bacterium]